MNMETPTRSITDHIINPCNDKLTITASEAPGAGGANHFYEIGGYDAASNVSWPAGGDNTCILFQNGPIAEKGVNGVTQEALLAIIIDRLRSFQAGPYACRENALALTKTQEALMWLKARTHARDLRGVEGTNKI